jgi:hypothetical protein
MMEAKAMKWGAPSDPSPSGLFDGGMDPLREKDSERVKQFSKKSPGFFPEISRIFFIILVWKKSRSFFKLFFKNGSKKSVRKILNNFSPHESGELNCGIR